MWDGTKRMEGTSRDSPTGWAGPHWRHDRPPPLVYQTTTSLGLAQVQLRSPKVVMVTGAAARALKNGITFLPKIKSSSPTKYEYVRPLSHCLRVQSIKFGIVQVDVRTSTYEHLHLLR